MRASIYTHSFCFANLHTFLLSCSVFALVKAISGIHQRLCQHMTGDDKHRDSVLLLRALLTLSTVHTANTAAEREKGQSALPTTEDFLHDTVYPFLQEHLLESGGREGEPKETFEENILQGKNDVRWIDGGTIVQVLDILADAIESDFAITELLGSILPFVFDSLLPYAFCPQGNIPPLLKLPLKMMFIFHSISHS